MRPWIAFLLAAVFSLCLNTQLRRAGELGFYGDDFSDLTPALASPSATLRSMLLTDEPIYNLYTDLRYKVFGDRPWRHHLWKGILGSLNVVLAFALVWRLSRDYLFSFLFLLLFATYPFRGEATYWLAAVYVFMLAWLLLALHLWLSWMEKGGRWSYIAAVACYSVAIFTHEASFGFLGIVAGLWLWKGRHTGWKPLVPFVLSNGIYLLMRQTSWLGLGYAGFVPSRPLSLGRLIPGFVQSLRNNFGEPFVAQVGHFMNEGAAGRSLAPAALAMMIAVLVVMAAAGGGFTALRRRVEGMALLGVMLAAVSFYSPGDLPPDLLAVFWLALRVVLVLAAVAMIRARFGTASVDAEWWKMGAFGCLWFLAAYAPTYPLHVALRHGYMPQFGLCLTLATAFWLPTRAEPDGHRRRLMEGIACGLVLIVGLSFQVANTGESGRWVAAHRYIERLKDQLAQAEPRLAKDTRVVVLDLPDTLGGVPMLPNWGFEAALRHWYGNDGILAAIGFLPEKQEFRLESYRFPHPYDRLLLFTYKDQVLRRVRELEMEDGSRIRLGEALGERDGAVLRVITGKTLR